MKVYSREDNKLLLQTGEISIIREFNKIYLNYVNAKGQEIKEELKNNITIREG